MVDMTPKSKKSTKPSGINEVIKKDAPVEEMKGRVICKKCGKDIEFKKTVRLHLKCPRCSSVLERNIDEEYKTSKRVITYDFFRRNKKYFLYLGFFLTAGALAYNIIGFFTQLFANHGFWLALLSIPLVLVSIGFTHFPRLKSQSKRHRFFAWTTLILNIVAVAAIIITSVPQINEYLLELYRV